VNDRLSGTAALGGVRCSRWLRARPPFFQRGSCWNQDLLTPTAQAPHNESPPTSTLTMHALPDRLRTVHLLAPRASPPGQVAREPPPVQKPPKDQVRHQATQNQCLEHTPLSRLTTDYPDRRRSAYRGRAEQVWLVPVRVSREGRTVGAWPCTRTSQAPSYHGNNRIQPWPSLPYRSRYFGSLGLNVPFSPLSVDGFSARPVSICVRLADAVGFWRDSWR
jgi:hypothetical protein